MENPENEVIEQVTENVGQPTEVPEKTFTQQDVDRMVKEKLDEVMPGKIARAEARIRKENDREYGELMGLLRAGTGKETVGDITGSIREFYGAKGIKAPQQPQYSQKDIEVLAQAEAEDVIRGGYDEVVAEVDRLAKVGAANMTPREKAVFTALAKHRQTQEHEQELTKLGVTKDVYDSKEFQDFRAMFSPSTPIQKVYETYAKTQPKKTYQTMGSMQQGQTGGAKDYYTPEEIERLTEADLDDPKVWEAVRRSMTGG